MRFRVEQAVLDRFPELTVGVLIVRGAGNRVGRESAASVLAEQVERVRSEWREEALAADPRLAVWRQAYRSFGAKPKKHRCSIENMLRTILDEGDVPSINPVVDLYNAVSLKHCIPVGGDDLDRVEGDLRLTIAAGDERFVPLNGTEAVAPKPGEVIYRDDLDVLCRRWNWRECDKSKLTDATTNLCLVVEGLPPATSEAVCAASIELSRAIERCCGGRAVVTLVDSSLPSVKIG